MSSNLPVHVLQRRRRPALRLVLRPVIQLAPLRAVPLLAAAAAQPGLVAARRAALGGLVGQDQGVVVLEGLQIEDAGLLIGLA